MHCSLVVWVEGGAQATRCRLRFLIHCHLHGHEKGKSLALSAVVSALLALTWTAMGGLEEALLRGPYPPPRNRPDPKGKAGKKPKKEE